MQVMSKAVDIVTTGQVEPVCCIIVGDNEQLTVPAVSVEHGCVESRVLRQDADTSSQ